MAYKKSIINLSILRSIPAWSNKKIIYILLIGLLLLMFMLSGCSYNPPRKTTPTPQPSITPQNSAVQITPLQISPVIRTTAEPQEEIMLVLDTSLYTHFQNLFSLQSPVGWVMTEDVHGAVFSDDQETAAIQVEVVNTGYPINPKSFINLVNAREEQKASEHEVYIEVDRQQTTNAYLVTKQLSNSNQSKTLFTLYRQQDQAILILDFLVDQSSFERYHDFLDELVSSISINSDAVTSLPLYSFDQALTLSNNSFSILTPQYWTRQYSREENSIINSITSPDEQAIIQTIVYDDGQEMTKGIAADLVLTLLRENYTRNIYVVTDQVLPDSREKLTWRSSTANYQGITTFGTIGSELFIVTVMWSNDSAQFYQSMMEAIIDSYKAINTTGG